MGWTWVPHGTHLCFPLFKWAFGGQELNTNWVICGLLCGSHIGGTHATQLILATYFIKAPIGLARVCGLDVGLTWDSCVCYRQFLIGVSVGQNWILTGSLVGCFVGPTRATHMGASYFWSRVSQRPKLGYPICGLNVGPTWDSCVFPPFFKWAVGVPELGINWVICGLLCGPRMGCLHGTQLIVATCFTKAPIGLAHVWAECGSHMGLVCVSPPPPFFLIGLSVGRKWILTGSFVGCFVGPTLAAHMGPCSFWTRASQISQLGYRCRLKLPR